MTTNSRARPCEACPTCSGNGGAPDGYPCRDCEGTGCRKHPFCDAAAHEEDHDA